jgi:N-acetylglutamate synthase-like GNAT family acetyltransferase
MKQLDIVNGIGIMIRPMLRKDIPEVIDLITRNCDDVLTKHSLPKVVEKCKSTITEKHFENRIAGQNTFVAEVAGQIVATGAISSFGDDDIPRYHISNIFVRVDLHGQGIGHSILEHLISLARGKSVKRLYVQGCGTGVSFFKRMGFNENEDQPESTDGVVWLELEL